MAETRDYNADAWRDALETVEHFADDIASQARDGEVSNDLFNDYPNGDGWHHESHVDRDYDLSESAAVLEQLSEDEETDWGLWAGQEPRKAIGCQAAYTYGNAVMRRWLSLIESINDCLERWFVAADERSETETNEPLSEDNRESIARVWIMLRGMSESIPDSQPGRKIAEQALAEWEDGNSAYAGVLADWLRDRADRWRQSQGDELWCQIGQATPVGPPDAEQDAARYDSFRAAVVALDAYLTQQPVAVCSRSFDRQIGGHKDVSEWIGREYYLSDGGYSRVVLSASSSTFFLTSNSIASTRARWQSAQGQDLAQVASAAAQAILLADGWIDESDISQPVS